MSSRCLGHRLESEFNFQILTLWGGWVVKLLHPQWHWAHDSQLEPKWPFLAILALLRFMLPNFKCCNIYNMLIIWIPSPSWRTRGIRFSPNPIAGIFQKLTGGYGPLQGPYEGESKTIHDGFAPSPPSLGCKSQNPIEITTTTITLFNYVI